MIPRKYSFFLTLVTAALILLGFGIAYKADQESRGLKVADKTFTVEVVNTDESRQKGLSGRESLPADTAMLFVFESSGERCFWMKDMKFSIDMVWLDESKKIVGVKENVAPSSYPDSFCHDNARYVVEFVSGTADKLDLKVGEQFSF